MAGTSYVYPPPSDGKPFRLIMGLRSMPAAGWIETGSDLDLQLIERQELISNRRDTIFGAISNFEQPALKFAELILNNLSQFHASEYQVELQKIVTHRSTSTQVDISADHPFLQLAKVIGEDLCLISKVDGQWLLTAAAVIYPSRWKLTEKLGKNLDQIHAPVPGYEEALQPAMSLTFDKLTSERQVWRLNWALHPDPNLHQPDSHSISVAPDKYWWRTERQTLTKLDGQDHVLFTIRNRAEPLSQILNDPISANAFAQTLNTMSPESIAYKGLTTDHQAIVDYLMGRYISH